ncbi:MAG: flagellar basal body rod protein FlgB [Gammaproteobacteria bacterium]|nr:flagellar basal body rod protein FlgB [Gammaproteobacteria bacterium]
MDINKLLDGHTRVLGLANQRLQLLADNIANADTPNYKARDIDFRAALKTADTQQISAQMTNAQHMSFGVGPNQAEVKYRVPDQASLDGNTVDAQKESASVAETAVRYQATLTFLTSRINGLRTAITGGR